MSYRNKTYVAFASEDIKSYWLMTAWHMPYAFAAIIALLASGTCAYGLHCFVERPTMRFGRRLKTGIALASPLSRPHKG